MSKKKSLFFKNKKSENAVISTYSQLLALEPRLVFDAAIAATVDDIGHQKNDEATNKTVVAALDPGDQAGVDAQSGQLEIGQNDSAAHEAEVAHLLNSFAALPDSSEQGDSSPENESDQLFTGLNQSFMGVMGITPASGGWNDDPTVDFSAGHFTVDEDTLLTIGKDGILITDPDTDSFKVTIKVDHGSLSLDYVAGVVGNKYDFNADKSEVTFEADAETVQKVLDTLKYQANKDYNGTDSLQISLTDRDNADKVTDFTQEITINPVADKPAFTGSATLPGSTEVYEDTSTTLKFNHGTKENPDWRPLQITDADGTSDTYDIQLTIKNGTLSGTGLGAGVKVGDTTTYDITGKSLAEINNILANLQFQGDQDFFGKADLGLTITDSAMPGDPLTKTFEIDVLAVNDAPTMNSADQNDRGNQLTVAETNDGVRSSTGILDLSHFNKDYDGSAPDANGYIPLFDVDNTLEQLMVKVESLPAHGTLWRQIGGQWIKVTVGSTFSLQDVYDGKVKYTHNSSHQVNEGLTPGSSQDSFNYSIVDGAGGSDNGTMYINLEPVNQEPSLVPDNPVSAYEGQQGIPFSFSVVDPDQSLGADYTLRFSELPNADYGVFWYSADGGQTYQKVTTSTVISLEAVKAGYLRFNHSGKETAIGTFSFKIEVTDDGGGDPAGAKTIECPLSMNILPNNDHPEWDPSVKGLWSDNQHTVTVNDTRVITITNSILNATDKDSGRDNITYTVNYNQSTGMLLYNTGDVDGQDKPIYRIIQSGEKVSQTDIDSGKVSWWFYGTGDKTTNLTFTVRDGSITTTPVPNDGDQPLDYPVPGGSASGWEHGSGPHEGAIGTWQETSSGSGIYEWVPTVHTLTLTATNIIPGEVPDNPMVVDPIPNFKSDQNTATVDEGKDVQLNDTMLKAWFTDKSNGNAVIDPTDPGGQPDKLVYRLEELPQNGYLIISQDGGLTGTVLGLYSSFTQQDVIDGKVYYRHNGSEMFSDNFQFSVSDGRNEAESSGNTTFGFNFDVTPKNDSPTAGAGADVKVNEHDTPNATRSTPGGVATITLANIAISDVDGTGDKSGQTDFSTRNDLYIIITSLPQHGKLFYNGVEITSLEALDPSKLAAIQAGGGYADWIADSDMDDVFIISQADIAAGKLTYQHDGSENYSDTFSYLVSDNKGINAAEAVDHNGGSVGGVQAVNVAVNPVNDRPEVVSGAPLQLDEAGTATITNSNINVVDPDGTPSATQFIVTKIPEYGQLTLGGKVLGIGSVFTQKDINNGLLKYTQDGSENHQDSFDYKLSDSIYMATDAEAEDFTMHINPVNDAPTIEVPDTIYVESIAGGVIINGIKITDPDYGDNNQYDGASDTGIVSDQMTVTLELDNPVSSTVDLSQVHLYFWNGSSFVTIGTRTGNTYTLTGTFAEIQGWLSQVKIQTASGGSYDPDGDIHINVTVHDGTYDPGTSSWINANGGLGGVKEASDVVKVYISPINDAPERGANNPASLTTAEDGAAVPVKDGGGNPIQITDADAFHRSGNSITLTAEHGILLVTPVAGPTITGRGTHSLTITGTLAEINAVLASLQYKADANYNGPDTISYNYKDNANSGDLPAGFTDTPNGNGQFKYDTGRKDASDNAIWGLGVSGAVGVTVTPVNDKPVITAPKEVFINSPLVFGGNDNLGNPATITLGDIDITGPGDFKRDTLTVTLSVDNTNGGKLKFTDLSGLTSDVSEDTWATSITLTGSLADLNAALANLNYTQDNWDAGTPSKLTITVSDVANGDQSNGSSDVGSAIPATHEILINCSNKNDGPAIDLPGTNWSATEDAAAAKIFNGAGAITLTDPDTFGGQVYGSISVEHGQLNITKADLQAAGFYFSGDPALQDAFKISADGKTIYFKADIEKIEAALKQITYKADANFNGEDTATVYVNDLGLWGDTTGTEESVPTNDLGLTGNGLAKTATGTIDVAAVNDAPIFTGGNNSSMDSIAEDITTGANAGQTVESLFSGKFSDTTDTIAGGSVANDFAGIVVTTNTANATNQGAWQYYDTNTSSWKNIGTVSSTSGLFLSKDTLVRFQPVANFNGAPPALTIHLAETGATTYHTGDSVNVIGVNKGGTTQISDATGTLGISVTAVNDAPTRSGTADITTTITEGATPGTGVTSTVSSLFGPKFLDTKDAQSGYGTGGSTANTFAGVVITGIDANANGVWKYSTDGGNTWIAVPSDVSETNGLYLNGGTRLSFFPTNTDYNTTSSTDNTLTVRLADSSGTQPANGARVDVQGANSGGSTRYSDDSNAVTLGVTVTAQNDAPVVKGGESMPSDTISEDGGATTRTVNDLFGHLFDDSKDDQTAKGGSSSNAFSGIAITSINTTLGTWAYFNGSSWVTISGVSDTTALYLSATTQIRFTPAANANTSGEVAGLTARLADNSSGTLPTSGTKYNVSGTNSGGTTRYSSGNVTWNLNITPVNDAPTIVTGKTTVTQNHTEDTTTTTTVNTLFGPSFSDAADQSGGSSPNTFAGVVVTSNAATAAQGVWQYYNGTTWINFPTVSEASGLYLSKDTQVRFQPAADFNGTPGQVQVHLVENGATTHTTGDTVDASAANRGTTTQISAGAVTLAGTVAAVNDAPVADNATDVTMNAINEDVASGSNAGQTLNDLFGGRFSDTKDDQSGHSGSTANTLAGVAIVDYTADPAKGQWQYYNGSAWVNIPISTASNAFILLGANTMVRFQPAADFNGQAPTLGVALIESGHSFTNGTSTNLSTAGARGGQSHVSAANVTLTQAVTAVNDAPTLTDSSHVNLTSITEDVASGANPGQTVNDLFGNRFSDAKDEVSGGSGDNAFIGIWVDSVGSDAAKGQWQYYDTGSSSWQAIAPGMFLRSDVEIRFQPAADYNSEHLGAVPAMSVRLVESTGPASTYTDPSQCDLTTGSIYSLTSLYNNGIPRYTGAVPVGLTVTAVNDDPMINYTGGGQTAGSPITVNEDTSLTFNGANKISLTDVDVTETTGGKLTVTLSVEHGTLTLGTTTGLTGYIGAAGSLTITGSLADLNTALATLSYQGSLDYNGTDALIVTVNDLGNTGSGGAKTSATTIYLEVNAVNDAPVIITGKETITQTTPEDTTWNGGSISDLFGPSFNDAKDNVAGGSSSNTLAGIFITDLDTSAGDWYYQDGGSGSWIKIDPLNAGEAFYLKTTDTLKLVPNSDYNSLTPTTITAHLCETGGTPHSTGVTTAPAYAADGQVSQNAVTLNVTVTPVNDAPVADNATDVTMNAINEDVASGSNAGQTLNDLFGGRFSDTKDDQSGHGGSTAGTLDGVAIVDYTADSSKGQWQYFDGTNWQNIPTATANNAFILLSASTPLRFQPAADFNGPAPSLGVALIESGHGFTNAASVDLTGATSRGGASHVSAATITLTQAVNAVNDAPTWNSDAFSNVVGPGDSHFIFGGELRPNRGNQADPANYTQAKTVTELFGSAFDDSRDTVPGGSTANTLEGVWVTGISGASSLGTWQYSTDGGNSWINITGVSESNALFLAANTQVRFQADITVNLPSGTPPHIGLNVALADSSNTSPTTGDRAGVSGANRGGITAISTESIPLWLTVHQKNYLPEINNINPVTTTERTPVNLAPGVTVADSDLDQTNNAQHWAGASVTLSRQGGANSQDAFSNGSGTLGPLTEGQSLVVGGTTIGTVTKNSGGELVITFNSSATNALVTEALSQINYTNTSHDPPASVTLQWLVDDGNYAQNGFFPQGDNPPGEDSGKTLATQTVTITAVSEDPVAKDDHGQIDADSKETLTGNVLANDYDPDGTALTVTTPGTYQGQYGTLTLEDDGSYTYTVNKDHPAVKALRPGESLKESFNYTIVDSNGGAPATAALEITIDKTQSDIVPVNEDDHDHDKWGGIPEATSHEAGQTHQENILVLKPVVKAVDKAAQTTERSLEKGLEQITGQGKTIFAQTKPPTPVFVLGDKNIYHLPDNIFYTGEKTDDLSYTCLLASGEPLPSWLFFDSELKTLAGLPPEDYEEDSLELVIIVRNSVGQEAKAKFTLKLAKEGSSHDKDQPPDEGESQEKQLGPDQAPADETPADQAPADQHVSLNSQIADQGRPGLLKGAQEFIDQILRL